LNQFRSEDDFACGARRARLFVVLDTPGNVWCRPLEQKGAKQRPNGGVIEGKLVGARVNVTLVGFAAFGARRRSCLSCGHRRDSTNSACSVHAVQSHPRPLGLVIRGIIMDSTLTNQWPTPTAHIITTACISIDVYIKVWHPKMASPVIEKCHLAPAVACRCCMPYIFCAICAQSELYERHDP